MRLSRDTRGLSTVEYVIILLIVGLVGVAAWRMFGGSTARRAENAGQDVGALDDGSGAQAHGGARGRGGIVVASRRSRLDDATGEVAAPPPETRFETPTWMLGLAAALVVFLVGQRLMKGDKGGGGDGGGGGAKA